MKYEEWKYPLRSPVLFLLTKMWWSSSHQVSSWASFLTIQGVTVRIVGTHVTTSYSWSVSIPMLGRAHNDHHHEVFLEISSNSYFPVCCLLFLPLEINDASVYLRASTFLSLSRTCRYPTLKMIIENNEIGIFRIHECLPSVFKLGLDRQTSVEGIIERIVILH